MSDEDEDEVLVTEELIIRFYNDDGNIRYAINGEDKDIFIDKDGKLGNSITGHLTDSLKNKTTMLGIYKNYLTQKSLSTKIANAVSSVGQTASSVKQGLKTTMTPIGTGIATSIHNIKNIFTHKGDKRINKGGKTKSKRSANANKTLKNRK